MQFTSYLSEGFRIARRHKRLIVILWLVPLIPALVLGAMAASNLMPNLGQSLFADRALDGDAFIVWMEFRSSPLDELQPILGRGIVVMALLTLLLQVVLSAGIVGALLEREEQHPFMTGIRRNLFRFARTAILFAVMTAIPAVLCWALSRGFFKLAEAQRDGRLDILGVVLAAVLFVVLWAPLDLASDLSRIAASRHDDRSMVRGFFRAWGSVIKKAGNLCPALSRVPVVAPGRSRDLLRVEVTVHARDHGGGADPGHGAAARNGRSRLSQAGILGRRGGRIPRPRRAALLPGEGHETGRTGGSANRNR